MLPQRCGFSGIFEIVAADKAGGGRVEKETHFVRGASIVAPSAPLLFDLPHRPCPPKGAKEQGAMRGPFAPLLPDQPSPFLPAQGAEGSSERCLTSLSINWRPNRPVGAREAPRAHLGKR
jgi:hypothetical protein